MKDALENNIESIEDVVVLKQRINELEQIIEESKRTEEALKESEAKFRFLSENMADVAFIVDTNLRTTYVSPSVERVLGFTPEERKVQRVEEQLTPQSLQLVLKTMTEEIKREEEKYADLDRSRTLILDYYHRNGSIRNLETNIRAVRDDKKMLKGFYGLSRDITERKRIEDKLRDNEKKYRRLSTVDNLTRLYNFRQFYIQLKIETDRSSRYEQPLALLLLDIDDFKAFNDAYGHIEGDNVLQQIGRTIKRCLRGTDFAYRYGGEEFTVILPMTTGRDCIKIAERIRKEVKDEIFSPLPGLNTSVTVSIGLAQYKHYEDMKIFVHRADQLMYQGKRNGKDTVCCDPEF